ncbi:MAG: 2Fe-2S iron-sulfur cluster-binding protein, partial [Chloroflexota bacterium]|nr:2Fe-2S iron-sulfur cluster-binding protein [Chloroflexota bacterium]
MTISGKAIVVFKPSGKVVEAEVGANLLDVALKAGVEVNAPCGGQGRCGRCKVMVEMGAVARRPSAKLAPSEETEGYALACQTIIKGDVVVVVPTKEEIDRRPKVETAAEKIALPFTCDWRKQPAIRKFYLEIEPPSLADNTNDLDRLRRELARQHGIKDVVVSLDVLKTVAHGLRDAGWKVTVTLDMRNWVVDATVPPRLLAIESGDGTRRNYGLAVDIGTTSVVLYLVDFNDGRVVDTASAYNAQISCGEDVISRIVYSQRGDGLTHLQRLVVGTINDLLSELSGRNKIKLTEINEVSL